MSHFGEKFCEIWRGPIQEGQHLGHAVVCDDTGQIIKAWGDPDLIVLPRSSVKMLQALPLLTSGAADKFKLSDQMLALACASHNGADIHTSIVQSWMDDLGFRDDDLLCGPQASRDKFTKEAMLSSGQLPCRIHNNCSGKHTGFLTLSKHLSAGLDYVDPNHPVQRACLEVFEQTTNEVSAGYGIDGCSAPNFAASLKAVARSMAWLASAHLRNDVSSVSGARLLDAMRLHPELVAGEGRACTELMRASGGRVVLKTGAEGFFVAIIPEKRIGVALKVPDGAFRASECAISAILVGMGVLDAKQPLVQKRLNPSIKNWDGIVTGEIKPAAELMKI